MKHYVVMEANTKPPAPAVWAWGLLTTGPGFDEVSYTLTDGFTPADLSEVPTLGAHLFTVLVEMDEDDTPSGR